jgi:hypothetical protein
MSSEIAFFAYPSYPEVIGQTIEEAIKRNPKIETWKALDVYGQFISEEVLNGIKKCYVFFADISVLNFNVTYEIGFAIGLGKRIVLTKNSAICDVEPLIREVGIFDTIGYSTYENSAFLEEIVKSSKKVNPLKTSFPINTKAPVYLIET